VSAARQDAAIGAWRLEFDDSCEHEHRRAVALAMPGDKRHAVFGVMRRDRVDIREPRREPAPLLDHSARPAHHGGRVRLLGAARVKASEHLR
jgi:hypothetical protein